MTGTQKEKSLSYYGYDWADGLFAALIGIFIFKGAYEIGMHAIRGGTIVGEHEIIFAGRDEVITLSHSARSKEVFAVGAVNAAVYMTGKQPGMYDMGELVSAL